MKSMKKTILMILALLAALCLSMAAFAEDTAKVPAAGAAADAAKAVAEEAQAAADAAKAETDALNEALEAYGKARSESRKLAALASLKEELDSYVSEGSLTQDQADLILKYYAEQLTLQQDGQGFGRGGKDRHGGMGGGRNGMDDPGSGKGGRHGRFGSQAAPETPDASAQEPAGL